MDDVERFKHNEIEIVNLSRRLATIDNATEYKQTLKALKRLIHNQCILTGTLEEAGDINTY